VDPVIPEGLLTIFQSHRVIGEDFLLRTDRPKAVLVGSSLSALLPQIALKPVYNLAMSGGSSLAGMRLVEVAEPAPRLLFIEANLLIRPADEELLSELLNPILLRIKRICDACRTMNQPVTVALSYVSKLRLKPLSEEEQDRLNMTARANPKTLRRGLSVQLEGTDSVVDPIAMHGVLDRLSSQIGELERRGTRVVFVEMPMHPDLIGTPYYRSGLDAAKARFPAPRYEWISFTDRTYETSDGAHLIYPDARAVAVRISDVARKELR
jgi:hypothetical protein